MPMARFQSRGSISRAYNKTLKAGTFWLPFRIGVASPLYPNAPIQPKCPLAWRYVKIARKITLSGKCRAKTVTDKVRIYEYSWFTYVGVFK